MHYRIYKVFLCFSDDSMSPKARTPQTIKATSVWSNSQTVGQFKLRLRISVFSSLIIITTSQYAFESVKFDV